MLKKYSLVLALGFSFSIGASPNTESDYTEAVLAYQAGKPKEALGLVSSALKESPQDTKAWELRGLILRDLGQTEQALSIFRKLGEAAIAKKLPAKETAPYAFQTGILLFELKRADEAKPYFQAAVKSSFNTAASEYFLGLISLEQSEPKQAETFFRHVSLSPSPLLSASAFYYLGVVAKDRDDNRTANWNWRESKRLAQTLISSSASDADLRSAEGLIAQADLALKGKLQNVPSFLGHVALMTAYDSNVLLNPLVDVGATGTSTAMETIRYSIAKPFQLSEGVFSASLRGSANYNFYPDAHGGQFFINDLGITYAYRPRAAVNWGLRSGALFIMRNDTSLSPNGALKRQSLGVPVAAFLNLLSTNTRWTNEFSFTPQTFFTDEGVSATYGKSGVDWRFRSEIQNRSGNRFLNPAAVLEIYRLQTSGEEYRMSGASVEVLNRFAFSQAWSLLLRASAAYNTYGERLTGARFDTQISFGAEMDYQLWDSLFGVVELSYLDNLSNITSIYRYRRVVAGAGLDYRF